MLIKKVYVAEDVVTMARQRIRNIFSNGVEVALSVSGGKDSICLNHLVFSMCASGEIDKSLLTVNFIDEEAIYPCIEKIVMDMRRQWRSIGVRFNWYAMEYRHFNCFNMLTQDESFICWDRTRRDVWVREKPPFAITSHPLFKPRKDTYQAFLTRINAGKLDMIGIRIAESIQRRMNVANTKKVEQRCYPIYDWEDSDVWKYIADNGLDYPDAYEHMYRTGAGLNEMRISQFFSVDTAKSLVKMCEYYPDLFNRICKREPNAYMAMIYFDTEFYRRTKERGGKDETDWKAKCLELLNSPEKFTTKGQKQTYKKLRRIFINNADASQKIHKAIYETLVGGDPKGRARRAILKRLGNERAKRK